MNYKESIGEYGIEHNIDDDIEQFIKLLSLKESTRLRKKNIHTKRIQEVADNGFNDLIIQKNGCNTPYSLDHLGGMTVVIPEFMFEDGRIKEATVNIRPTNHVYSRKLEDQDDCQALKQSKELLLKYEHYLDDPQKLKINATGHWRVDSDRRVFCDQKYSSSLLLPDFVNSLDQNPISVLPNTGDTRTCLSALFRPPEEHPMDSYFLVFFTLHKVDACTINMVIETSFFVGSGHPKVKLLVEAKHNHRRKPFFTLLKNIFSGRGPFESAQKRKRVKAKKRGKKKKGE